MSAGPYRLALHDDRTRVPFTFDGHALEGIEGDTIASALLANGVRVVSRSFKFHRPRGVISAGFEEPNALVQIHSGARAIPSVRATLVPLTPHLEVFSQSGWPSVSRDVLRALDWLHLVFAAGFYNKAFIWPSWGVYEPVIRLLAGLGHTPAARDPDRYETRHAHCEVLIVGGGAAGRAAAQTYAGKSERVWLVDGAELTAAGDISAASNLTLKPHTVAVGMYDHGLVALLESINGASSQAPRERLWLVRARRIVLATGAVEQPLIFSNNDRPGIFLAGAARTYLERHGIAPGRRVVIATNNDSAYDVAKAVCRAGVNVLLVVDSRDTPEPTLIRELQALGVRVRSRSMPIDSSGFSALKSVTVATLTPGGIGQRDRIPCDALLVSGGWSPTLHLYAQAGGKLQYSVATCALSARGDVHHVDVIGAAAGECAGELGPRVSPIGNRARQWVDLRHDVTVSDLDLAVRENFCTIEHLKRYTTLGMSVDQGKLGQAAATEIIAGIRGIPPQMLGHTTFRPPFVPVTLGAMVGRNVGDFFAPTRHTPLHAEQAAAGAQFEDYGEWQRAAYFAKPGESREDAIRREVHLVRTGLGIYDASSLGKIELKGPDALEFADRFYCNSCLLTLKPQRVRYGLMLRDSGAIFDDGTVAVLDDDRVLLTTTSSGASRVAAWLEEWRQCEWPDQRVVVVTVTDQWATVALTGRQARAVLERLKPKCDLSNDAFPHLSVRVTSLLGSEARIYRVSFSGELTYEINVPSHRGADLWSVLMDEGRSFGIGPYGVEALLHLRMEKGFIHVGADTDGTTVPDDIGFGNPASAKQKHYIGKRSLTLAENVRPDRLQLIGLAGLGRAALPVGGHLRLPDSHEATDGWVTSAGLLSSDGKPVGMAMLRAGRNQMGNLVTVHDGGRVVAQARVVRPLFYDPQGMRTNV